MDVMDKKSLKQCREIIQWVRYGLQDIPSGSDCDEMRGKLYTVIESIDTILLERTSVVTEEDVSRAIKEFYEHTGQLVTRIDPSFRESKRAAFESLFWRK